MYQIAVLKGDGIGPEVVHATLKVLDAAASAQGVRLAYQNYEAGALYYQKTGESISIATMMAIGRADAILLGAMGLPDVRKADGTEIAPQIDIREHYQLFASLRPAQLFAGVNGPLRVASVDMLVIREITEGLFAGRHDRLEPSDKSVSDRMTITRSTSEKLFEAAFAQARLRRQQGRRGHVTLFDKSNVLRSNAFLRKIFDEVAARHPDIDTARLYIDAGAMMMVLDPTRFDVIVTENIFGDITSEIAAGLAGGLGVAPSADISESHAVFQPSHGTAPDIAGMGIANPIATILSGAMMLEWIGGRHDNEACFRAAEAIRTATAAILESGPRTRDLGGTAKTTEVTAAIVAKIVESGRTNKAKAAA